MNIFNIYKLKCHIWNSDIANKKNMVKFISEHRKNTNRLFERDIWYSLRTMKDRWLFGQMLKWYSIHANNTAEMDASKILLIQKYIDTDNIRRIKLLYEYKNYIKQAKQIKTIDIGIQTIDANELYTRHSIDKIIIIISITFILFMLYISTTITDID